MTSILGAKDTQDKKIIGYGASKFAAGKIISLVRSGVDISYIVDINPEKQNHSILGIEVKSPDVLEKEDFDKIIVLVLVGWNATPSVKAYLNKIGMISGKHYFSAENDFHDGGIINIDPILSYSRPEEETFVFHNCSRIPDANKKTILAMGGSNTDPYLWGMKSWPEYLSEIVDDEWQVINGAVQGYNSAQELLKLSRDVFYVCNPDIVISYSGINDIEKPCFTHPFWRNLLNKNLVKEEDSIFSGIYYGRSGEIKYNSRFFIDNERMMHAICSEMNVEFIGILQPCLTEGKYDHISPILKEYIDMLNFTEITHSFYKKVREEICNYDYLYDFTTIFDNNSDVYIDYCHTKEIGNEIIANEIYKIIKEKGI